jgi:hypothetical protein
MCFLPLLAFVFDLSLLKPIPGYSLVPGLKTLAND